MGEEMRLSMVINEQEVILGHLSNELESAKADNRIADYPFYRKQMADACFRILATYKQGGIEPCSLI